MTASVLVVAQRKGGSGKTTLAAHLAVAWKQAGCDVALIDADPQATLGQWHSRREARLGPGRTGFAFAAAPGWRTAGEIIRRARDHALVVVDSPASADSDTRTAIRSAGLTLVPVQPSPPDVWATLATLELAQQEGVPALLVLNRVPPRASLTAEMRERLARNDVGLARMAIGNRVVLAAAMAEGHGVCESAPGSPAAGEIMALAAEVLELLPLDRPPARLAAPRNAALVPHPA